MPASVCAVNTPGLKHIGKQTEIEIYTAQGERQDYNNGGFYSLAAHLVCQEYTHSRLLERRHGMPDEWRGIGMTSRSRKAFYEDSQSYETTGQISFSLYIEDSHLSRLAPAVRDSMRADIHAAITQIPTMLNQLQVDQSGDLIEAKEAIEAKSSDEGFGIVVSFDNLDKSVRYSRSFLQAYLTSTINSLQLVATGADQGISTPSTRMTQLEHAAAAVSSNAPGMQQEQWHLVGAGSSTRGSRSSGGPGSVMRS